MQSMWLESPSREDCILYVGFMTQMLLQFFFEASLFFLLLLFITSLTSSWCCQAFINIQSVWLLFMTSLWRPVNFVGRLFNGVFFNIFCFQCLSLFTSIKSSCAKMCCFLQRQWPLRSACLPYFHLTLLVLPLNNRTTTCCRLPMRWSRMSHPPLPLPTRKRRGLQPSREP